MYDYLIVRSGLLIGQASEVHAVKLDEVIYLWPSKKRDKTTITYTYIQYKNL